METVDTRDLVRRFFTAWAARDEAALEEALAEDAEWYVPSSMEVKPFIGRAEVIRGFIKNFPRVFNVDTAELDFHKVVADGDTAVVLQRLKATTARTGAAYENEYCWVCTCRDGKIVRLVEYLDTFYAAKTLGMVTT